MFNLIRRDPDFTHLFTLGREMGRLFDNEPVNAANAWLPPVDIFETEKELRVVCEVPGLGKDDIELTLVNNVLTISGEKKAETEQKSGNWHRSERVYGKFTRSFTLPRDVDSTKIQAKYNSGLLEIELPKMANAIPHKIEIVGK